MILIFFCCFLIFGPVTCQRGGRFSNFFDRISSAEEIFAEYDFVVVGAGSGGCVVANRLSENPDWTVLLIEAGGDESLLTDIPLMASLQGINGYNWNYKSQKMKTSCLGATENRCNLPRGKGLGGTSIINFLIYSRGHKKDFDDWSDQGNYGWSYKEVLPYFIKSENCSKCFNIDEKFHGFDGYLNVENPKYETPMVNAFIKAGKDMGYSYIDGNVPSNVGFSKVQATMKDSSRCSASKAFLKPVKDRTNLHILMHAQVTKILIDSNKAYGVEYFKSTKRVVYSKKEVIISAGSFNSPQLLMLSGIGPRNHLKKMNIPVIQNLPVGYNLQDHVSFSGLAFLVNTTTEATDVSFNPRHIFNFFVNGNGPLTLPGGAEAIAYINTVSKDDYPDIELVLGVAALNGDIYGSLRSVLGIPYETFRKVYLPVAGRPSFSIVPVLMRPRSRGRVFLRNNNPLSPPVIITNYLDNDEDLRRLVNGIRLAINITKSPHFKKFDTKLLRTPLPGCEDKTFGTDEYWICSLRQIATSLGHQVGTCKMGTLEDKTAVVDPELRVIGISNLRVADASVMPNVIAGHTNAAVFMIGEKVSDLIKETWQKEI